MRRIVQLRYSLLPAVVIGLVFCALSWAQEARKEVRREVREDRREGPREGDRRGFVPGRMFVQQRTYGARPPGIMDYSGAQMKEALSERISLELVEVPLVQAVDKVRQDTELNIVLSPDLLEEPEERPVTVRVKDVSVGNLLRVIALSQDIEMVIDEDIVLYRIPLETKMRWMEMDRSMGGEQVRVRLKSGDTDVEVDCPLNMLPDWLTDGMIQGLAKKLQIEPPADDDER